MKTRRRLEGILLAFVLLLTGFVQAQELDLEMPSRPKPETKRVVPSSPPVQKRHGIGADVTGNKNAGYATQAGGNAASEPTSAGRTKPLSITVTKTLYLPPAMYGQWSVTGSLLRTNAPDFFNPVVNDIWLLERQDDAVVVTNPANGASAMINVDRVEGDRATFHREGPAGRNRRFLEIPTITVNGDFMSGQSLNKIRYLKDGVVVREIFALYSLEARRISAGRVQFRPEAVEGGPDIEIEDVQVVR